MTPETRMPSVEKAWQRRLESVAALFSGFVFLAGLGLFAYNGTFARLWADDYCYSAVTKSAGLWGGVVEWYLHSGNRFSSAAAVAVSDWFGPGVVAFLPLLFIVLAASGWFFFLYQLKRLLGWVMSDIWLALLALMQTYFLALLAPDRLQTIYWRMGMLHYSLPLALLLFQLGLAARAARLQNRPALPLASLALLAFFAGGNSETFAFLQLGFWGLVLLLVLVLQSGLRRAQSLLLAAASALGALLALVVMFFSPQNADRLAVMPPPDNLWLILPVTARYVADFVFFAVRGQLTPFLVFLAASAALSWLVMLQGARLSLRSALLGLAVTLIAIPLLIAASFFPSAYAGLLYPSGRALMPAAFTLIAGLGAAVFFAASLFMHIAARPGWARWLSLAALLVLLAASLYPLRAAQVQLQEQQRLATWAARWDERDQLIRQSLAEGNRAVQIREVEVIWSLEDLGPDPEFWINRCAAVYYGAGSITANR